jgi:hypothetical protein
MDKRSAYPINLPGIKKAYTDSGIHPFELA